MLFSLMLYCIGYMTIKKVSEHFWQMLRSNRRPLIQCGDYGNLQKIYLLLNKLQKLISSAIFSKTRGTLAFRKGRRNDRSVRISTSLYLTSVLSLQGTRYSSFMKTVVMKPFLDYLTTYELIELVIDKVVQTATTKNNKQISHH